MSNNAEKAEFDCYVSKIDGLPIIHIDTPDGWQENENGPMFRVFINDDTENPIWDASEPKPEPTGPYWGCEVCECTDIEVTAWVHVNSGKDTGGDPPNDNFWCPQCEHNDGEGEVAKMEQFADLKPFTTQGKCGQCHATGETGTTCRECGRGVIE